MITQQQIDQLRHTIVDSEDPQQIILFGSYAYGEPHVVDDYTVPYHQSGPPFNDGDRRKCL